VRRTIARGQLSGYHGQQHSEREREFTFAKIVWFGGNYWSLKIIEEYG